MNFLVLGVRRLQMMSAQTGLAAAVISNIDVAN
jgi:hypothetical protein